MRFITIVTMLLLFSFSFADIEFKYDSTMKTPNNCVKKKHLIKCPDEDIDGAGHIFNTKKNEVYSYYPKDDEYEEQYAISICDSITTKIDPTLSYRFNKAQTDEDSHEATKFRLKAESLYENGDYSLHCNKYLPKLNVKCLREKKIVVSKFDEIGVVETIDSIKNNNHNHCRDLFKKAFSR